MLGLSKSDRRKYHNFIENFMALYQSPRWSHVKPNSRYLSNILSFYANLGDVDNALKVDFLLELKCIDVLPRSYHIRFIREPMVLTQLRAKLV